MVYQARITIDPRLRSGKPCLKGTRTAAAVVLDYFGGSMTMAQIFDHYPGLKAGNTQACLTSAAVHERRLTVAA